MEKVEVTLEYLINTIARYSIFGQADGFDDYDIDMDDFNECVVSKEPQFKKDTTNVVPPSENDGEDSCLLQPKELKFELDKYIVGQEEAKEYISAAVYNHYKRIKILEDSPEVEIQKSNIFMIGSTGTGKTHMMRCLAEILNTDLVILTATDYTPNGYVGTNIDSIPGKILSDCNNDIERAEKAIVYIDEFDKLSMKRASEKGNLGQEVQAGILRIIEGGIFSVKSTSSQNGIPMSQTKKLNTESILFVCGGAFTDLTERKLKEISKPPLGFNNDFNLSDTPSVKLNVDDIVAEGIMRELMGRLPIIVHLDNLTEDDMVKILTEPKNALLKQYRLLLKYDNVSLHATQDALKEIGKSAIKNNTGARGLKTILEKILHPIVYSAKDNSGKLCVLTKTTEVVPEIISDTNKEKFYF